MAALLVGFAPPALATWLAPQKLSATGQDAQTPAVAMNGNGDSEVVWARPDGTTTGPIVETDFRAAGPGNMFAPVQDVSSDMNASSTPQVGEDQYGDAEAVWAQDGEIWWSWRTNDVFGFGTPGTELGTDSGVTDPHIAVDANGDAIAVWDWDDGGIPVVREAFAPAGSAGTFGTPVTLSNPLAETATNPVLAEDANGDAIAMWQEYNGTDQEIQFAYQLAGNAFSAPHALVPADSNAETNPAVTMDGSGDASVAWVEDSGGQIVDEADASQAELTGATPGFGSPTTLSVDSPNTNPQISDDSNGDTAVVWNSNTSVDGAVRPTGAMTFTGTPGFGSLDGGTVAQVAMNSNGNAIAVWQSSNAIEADVATTAGSWASTPIKQISTGTTPATDPVLAVDDHGDAVASWLQSDNSNEIATAAGYDPDTGPTEDNLHMPANAAAGKELTFYAQPTEVWPAITSTTWDFGDGSSPQTGDNVVHTFAAAGNHTVTLTATDADGNTSTSTQQITVAGSPPTVPAGGIAQMAAPNDCVTSGAVGCGTLIPYGLSATYQQVVSPDNKYVYAVGLEGGVVEFSRDTSTGALTQKGCITSAVSANGCTNGALALNNPSSIAISPDGADVYVVTQGNRSIVTFARDALTGQLTEKNSDCYSSYSLPPCTTIAGLENPYAVVVSPDGRNVYATGYDNHDVTEFTRNTSTGLIQPIPGNNCISDGTEAACNVETAEGMTNAVGIAVSPDGNNVYVTAGGTQGNGDVAEFTRSASSGALAPLAGHGCIGSATAGCDAASAIHGSEDMAISSDGKFAYINSFSDDAVVELSRNATSGALSQIGCVETSEGPGGLCSTSNAVGIDGPLGVALSPDGKNLYASGAADNAEAAFSVNSSTGLLTQLTAPNNCVTSNSSGCGRNDATGLFGARRVTVSPDGKSVYVAGQGGPDAVAELSRTPVPAVTPPPPSSPSTEASYDSNDPASKVTATITVPAVSCSGVAKGTFAGQGEGVELYGSETIAGNTITPAEAANVRTYCNGTTAVYEPEFIVNDVPKGTLDFHPAGLTVHPGDPLQFSISAATSGAKMQITDVNTKRSATITGPGFSGSDGPDIGITAIYGNGHGAPMLSGSESAANPAATIAGPVPSSPVLFQDVTVDGAPLSKLAGLYTSKWTNASGGTLASVSPISGGNEFTVGTPSVSQPKLRVSADAAVVSGTVLVKLPGSKKFVRLTNPRSIPIGSTINATHGSVQITVALPGGKTQTGVFFGGEFILRQSRNGETTAVLTGGSFKGCPKPPPRRKHKSKHHAPRAQAASASRRRPVRSLWSNSHGSYSTKGRYGAGAVRGTEWFTQDQCDGTYFRVTRDLIQVTSFARHNHRTTVRQGHHFLAPAPGYK